MSSTSEAIAGTPRSLHPAVQALLSTVTVTGQSSAHIAPAAVAVLREQLLSSADPVPFFSLAIAWARFHQGKVRPITGQLFELLRLFPSLQAGASDAQVRQLAKLLAVGKSGADILKSSLMAPNARKGSFSLRR